MYGAVLKGIFESEEKSAGAFTRMKISPFRMKEDALSICVIPLKAKFLQPVTKTLGFLEPVSLAACS